MAKTAKKAGETKPEGERSSKSGSRVAKRPPASPTAPSKSDTDSELPFDLGVGKGNASGKVTVGTKIKANPGKATTPAERRAARTGDFSACVGDELHDICEAEDDETPQMIAQELGVSLEDLLALNKPRYHQPPKKLFTATARLMEGTHILLPPAEPPSSSAPGPSPPRRRGVAKVTTNLKGHNTAPAPAQAAAARLAAAKRRKPASAQQVAKAPAKPSPLANAAPPCKSGDSASSEDPSSEVKPKGKVHSKKKISAAASESDASSESLASAPAQTPPA